MYERLTDLGDIAVAIGNGSVAQATGGILDTAFADGTDSEAFAEGGGLDSATTIGTETEADAGATPAADAYTGAPFTVNREYAEASGGDWVILSAKYGFLRPTDIIPGPYEVTFKVPSKLSSPHTVRRSLYPEARLLVYGPGSVP